MASTERSTPTFTGVYFDETGTPVPDCSTVPAGTPCDYWNTVSGVILPTTEALVGLPGSAFRLRTVLDPARYPIDFYTKTGSETCSGGTVTQTTRGLEDWQMTLLRSAYSAHELGHALHMEHTAQCGNLMYDNVPNVPRRTMADVLPIPTHFTTLNLDQIVLTEP